MKFVVKNFADEHALLEGRSECLVLGMAEGEDLGSLLLLADEKTGGLLSRLVAMKDLSGKAGTTVMLREPAGIGARRLLIVGMGPSIGFARKEFLKVVDSAWGALARSGTTEVLWAIASDAPGAPGAVLRAQAIVRVLRERVYRVGQFKSQPDTCDDVIREAHIAVFPIDAKAVRRAVIEGTALENGMDLTRDLGNAPGNVCTPSYLAEKAMKMGHEWGMKVEVLGPKRLQTLRMGALLSVAQGSREEPRLIVIHYQGAERDDAPVVLVGKGVTFDSGGISIKPSDAMDEMKFDMSGAGAVAGTLRAIAEMKLKLNVIGVIAACENLPDGNALKPGDIVTGMSGQTIEILNTDAEGRLILSDALTYVQRFGPAAVIDIATLTGACVIALGHHHSGLFSKDDSLASALLHASQRADDPAWRMPLDDEYHEALKSNFADVSNLGGRPAGAITAAAFLSRFTDAYPWAHLDIAGTAVKPGTVKSATGRPVPLLVEFLKQRVNG